MQIVKSVKHALQFPDSTIQLPSTEQDILQITRQVIDSSARWNEAAISIAMAAAAGESVDVAPDLLPKNILFVHDSSARRMSSEEWNALALDEPPKAP